MKNIQQDNREIKIDKYGKLIKLESNKPRCRLCFRTGVALNNGTCVRCFDFNKADYTNSNLSL